MHIIFLFKGLVIGLSIAVPVGPIGVLCVRRTLAAGRFHGFISGLGAATADAFYGLIAGFGLTFVLSLLVEGRMWFRLIGGIFLLYIGIKTFLSIPSDRSTRTKEPNHVSAYVSTLFLTLTNPMTVLLFAAIFAGFGLVNSSTNHVSVSILVIGVFLGSALWWLILSNIAGLFRKRINHGGLRWVNRISGAMITFFGLVSIVSLLL